ncbi:MAG: type IV pilin protein [Burkholderiales bacterium]|nr:type IV pilin protein [Burkholderiales bacterium]MDE2564980.1 type IV pilin protein [Burkholderiales bacterium]
MRRPTPLHGPRVAGFTLVELMIAIVVLAVLAAVAFPSYLNALRKGRRSEAVAALSAVQQGQERWRANNQQYTTSLTDLNSGMPASGAVTGPGGYYALSIEQAGATGYVLAAQAVAGTSQAGDTGCQTMRLQLFNGAIFYGGCNACSTPAAGAQVSDPNRCWSK